MRSRIYCLVRSSAGIKFSWDGPSGPIITQANTLVLDKTNSPFMHFLGSAFREVSPEATLSEEMLAMSLKEGENQALVDIACIELEDGILQLEEKRACLLLQRSRCSKILIISI